MSKVERIKELYKNENFDVKVELISYGEMKMVEISWYRGELEVCRYTVEESGITIEYSHEDYQMTVTFKEMNTINDIIKE